MTMPSIAPVGRAGRWCLAPWLGRDGRPSRTMFVTTVVLASYLVKRPIPEMVSIFAIISTYGIKPIMAWIERSSSALTSSSRVELEQSSREETRHETRKIEEVKTLRLEVPPRDPDTGEQVTRGRELPWESLLEHDNRGGA